MKFTIFQTGFVDCEEKGSFQVDLSQSTRSDNAAGLYNSAVELIISKRFQFQLSLKDGFLAFPEINLEIKLYKFCEIGGFDESEEIYFVEEFIHREKNFSELNNLNVIGLEDSTFKQKVAVIKNKNYLADQDLFVLNKAGNYPVFVNLEHNVTIGITVGSTISLENLLNSLYSSFEEDIKKFSFVICCFGTDKSKVTRVFSKLKIEGERTKILEEDWGIEQARLGALGDWFLDPTTQSGVSFGRCVLHRALYEYSNDDVIWILDDDIVFSQENKSQLIAAISEMREKRLEVGVGFIIGDAPLPPPYIIRTQAVDFYYASFARTRPKWSNNNLMNNSHDVHHDLSTSRSDHLEIPIGIDKAYDFSIDNWSIFSGKSITRTIHNEWETFEGIPTRGGNTLLLSKSPLISWPNVSPKCGGIQFRRGDTIWAKLIERDKPELIDSVRIGLHQARESEIQSFSSIENLRGDILGSMFTRTIGDQNISPSEIIKNANLREARLLINLIRSYYILEQLSYDKNRLLKLKQFVFDLENTSLPDTLHDDLEYFVNTFGEKINTFRVNGNKGGWAS